MSWQRGTSLIEVSRIVQLTAQPGLELLETEDWKRADVLLAASDAVFDRLVSDGVAPGELPDATPFERVVAYHFLGLLAAIGVYLEHDVMQQRFFALSDRYYQSALPQRSRGRPAPVLRRGVFPWTAR